MLWAPEPKLDSWQLRCPCSTFTVLYLSLLSPPLLQTLFPWVRKFFQVFCSDPSLTSGLRETQQTVWGNQSSERVEAEDEVLSLCVCVCVYASLCVIWVDFSGMLFGLRLRIRRLCDCDWDWDRVGDGDEEGDADGDCLMPAWMVGGSILIAVVERKRLLLLLGICN